MTWLWAICFSAVYLNTAALPVLAGTVTGRVELRDSRDPDVRKGRDYSGVVISLKPMDVAASLPASGHSSILQKNKMFTPHVLAIAAGTSVDFPNEDPIFHNAFSSYSGQIFDVGLYPPGTSRSVLFTRPGIVRVFCNIHSSMSAMIVVLATPYFATTGRDGVFKIPNVPPGEYTLQVFHERSTDPTLRALGRRITVDQAPLALPDLSISEAGFLPIPHGNKYGRPYPTELDEHTIYPGTRK